MILMSEIEVTYFLALHTWNNSKKYIYTKVIYLLNLLYKSSVEPKYFNHKIPQNRNLEPKSKTLEPK